MSRLQQIRSI